MVRPCHRAGVRVKLLILPEGSSDEPLGALNAIGEADIVVTADGRVVKDRAGSTWVKVLTNEQIGHIKERPTLGLGGVPVSDYLQSRGQAGPLPISDGESAHAFFPGRYVCNSHSVRLLLELAIAAEETPRLCLTYDDRHGDRSTREIYPSKIEKKRMRGQAFQSEYLIAVDIDADMPKSFRLDRIVSLEVM